jgi:hypothetical protein
MLVTWLFPLSIIVRVVIKIKTRHGKQVYEDS